MSRSGGLKAHRNGEAFESLIEQACFGYMRTGQAYIVKHPEPMKPIRPMQAGRFLACYTKTAQPDYSGTLKFGRSVVFEAKHTDSDRIERKRVTPEQSAALDSHYWLGGECFILISFKLQRFYRVPWGIFRDMKGQFFKMSVTEADLAPYRVDILFFLKGLEAVAS